MFKNLTIYRLASGWTPDLATIEAALLNLPFTECGLTQDLSVGWVDPRGTGTDALVESVAGQRIMKLMIETKTVPASAVLKHARQAAEHIEQTTGRKPGRKEMKALRDDAQLALLPQAFPKQSAVLVWIDTEAGLLMHDAGGQAATNEVITALVRTFDGLALKLVQTNVAPVAGMVGWLVDGDTVPDAFAIGRETELKSADESKAAVQFKNHHLDTDEVRKHIADGKLPTRLALCWDLRVGFTLTDGLQLRKIEFLDGAFDDADPEADGFDADVTLATGELRKLIPCLLDALGGELVMEGGAA
jgi:recombination associated protein RdgC